MRKYVHKAIQNTIDAFPGLSPEQRAELRKQDKELQAQQIKPLKGLENEKAK